MRQIVFLCALLFSSTAQAQTHLYVDSSIASPGSGSSWGSAYASLSQALAATNAASTSNKYEIHIAKGTYYPPGTQSSTNRDTSFLILRGGIKLWGGYPSGGGLRNSVLNPVVLSGNIGNVANAGDNSCHIMVVAGIGATADSIVVDGITFANGSAGTTTTKTYNGQSILPTDGGGMFCRGVAAGKLTVKNCSLINNYAGRHGGGLVIMQSALTILDCVFSGNNAAASGGGVYEANTQGLVSSFKNCMFTSNISGDDGGGLYNSSSASTPVVAPYLHKCSFQGNIANNYGGGARFIATSVNYIIDSSTFAFNKCRLAGGGIAAVFSSSPTQSSTISNTVFSNDSSTRGGALQLLGNVDVNNCRFNSNKANRGGAINYQSRVHIGRFWNNSFAGNTAQDFGGGMWLMDSNKNTIISGCLFSGNKALIGGGGLCDSGARPLIVNSTFSGDTAHDGNAIGNKDGSFPRIKNCIIWDVAGESIDNSGSSDSVSFSIVEGGYPGVGNMSFNPHFVSPVSNAAAPTTAGDYRITACSPAIDFGIGNFFIGTKDLIGNNRVYGSRVDLGAYEFQSSGLLPQINGTDSVCVGSTTTMTTSGTGGVWASTDTSIAVVSSTGVVLGKAVGSVIITYLPSGSPCSVPGTKALVVDAPYVEPIRGASGICLSIPGQLTSLTPGGVWSSTDTNVATVNTGGFVTGKVMGLDTIVYTVTNVFGCATKIALPIQVGNCADSVWPGDVNYDKLVDNRDALGIALAMGSTGPTRAATSVVWVPERCVQWNGTIPGFPSANRKHGDCNGDGVINYGDLLAISTNYGLTHPKEQPAGNSQKTAGIPDLYYDFSNVRAIAGTTVSVPIKLGDAASPLTNVAGLAAKLRIDWVLPSDTPRLSYPNSWLGNLNNTLRFDMPMASGRVDWAYGRVDHGNSNGFGELAQMTFKIPPGTQGQQMRFFFDQVVIVDSNGQVYTQYNVLDDTVTILDPAGVSGLAQAQGSLAVWPNPSREPYCHLALDLPIAGPFVVYLTDLSGKIVYQEKRSGKPGLQHLSLLTGNLSAGTYIIRLDMQGFAPPPVKWIRQ